MSITIQEIRRVFRYNGILLPDLPGLDPREVRDLYSAQYPELVSAEVEPGEVRDGVQEFNFRKAVGTKGARKASAQSDARAIAPITNGPRLSALLARIAADEAGQRGVQSRLARAMTSPAMQRRASAFGRFASATLSWHRRPERAQRATVTSDLLPPVV